MKRTGLAVAGMLLASLVPAEGARAETTVLCNIAIPVSDGARLRATVGLPGPGAHPTILMTLGYNKDFLSPAGNCAVEDWSTNSFVRAGYNFMYLDDRGSGSSDGRWDGWGERTQHDYAEVLDWLGEQDWNDGNVGLWGGSYGGITALFSAETGHPSVKAVWAEVPMADPYRDVGFFGGNLDTAFSPLWLGVVLAFNANAPTQLFQGESPDALAANVSDHFGGPGPFISSIIASSLLGYEGAGALGPHDSPAWRLRSPVTRAGEIRAPVFYTGGWFDIFQRGEPELWNALTGTPVRKWVQDATYHGGTTHWESLGLGSPAAAAVAWFDHWLKGVDNGIESFPPIHLWNVGAERWDTPAAWPLPGTNWTSLYLSPSASGSATSINDGSLSASPPAATAQLLPFTPVGGLCNRSLPQWTAGAAAGQPCETDQRPSEAVTLTYSTPSLDADLHLAGPITLDMWASLDRRDTSFYAALTDVAPDGTSTQITSGALNASFAELDDARTWRNADGDVILPWHPFTVSSQQDVVTTEPREYQIEIFPTDWTIGTGHRLRLVIGTADTPHYQVPLDRLALMLGGTIRVLEGGPTASRLLLPVQP